jgi:hypothetical protein
MAKTVSFESFTSLEQFLFMCWSSNYIQYPTCSDHTESFFGLHVGYVQSVGFYRARIWWAPCQALRARCHYLFYPNTRRLFNY